MPRRTTIALTAVLALAAAVPAYAQQPAPAAPAAAAAPAAPPVTPYGAPMNLETAKKAMAASEAEAKKNNWAVAIAIIDSTGHLLMFQKLDNTQHGSIGVAIDKAQTAVDFRRPSKVFEDGLAAGGAGLRILAIKGVSPLEGGVPVIVDGKLVGAIGVSGVTSQQDAQIARAGADAAK